MEFIKTSNACDYGQPYSFDEIKEGLLEPAFSRFFNDDVKFLYVNWHSNIIPIGSEELTNNISGFLAPTVAENKKTVVVVNFGWTNVGGGCVDISKKMNELHLCNEPAIRFVGEYARRREYACYNNKLNIPLAVWFKSPKGYSILYFLWDAAHVVSENGVKEISEELLPIALNCYNADIFKAEFAMKQKVEGKVDKENEFISIYDKAVSVIGGVKNIPEVKQEMIQKAPIKQLVLFLNQIAHNRYNFGRDSTKHVDNKIVEKWLDRWAENKWPYYVMFGRKLEISEPISYEIDENRDRFNIIAMINDLRIAFPKYALIIDQFVPNDIIKNVVTEVPQSINELLHIKRGEKVSSVLSRFLGDSKFDMALSKIIEQNSVNSVVHISINPMDYLTSAISKHKWKSCHHAYSGERAAGPASYMFDGGTLCAFMATDKLYLYDFDDKGKPFTWNSKTWRQIIYGDYKNDQFIFAREYPQDHFNNVVVTKVRSMLEKVIADFSGIDNIWKISRNSCKKGNHYVMAENQVAYDDVPHREHSYIRHKYHKPTSDILVGTVIHCPITDHLITDSKKYFYC